MKMVTMVQYSVHISVNDAMLTSDIPYLHFPFRFAIALAVLTEQTSLGPETPFRNKGQYPYY